MKKITDFLVQLDRWSKLRGFLIEHNHIDIDKINHEYSLKETLLDTETLILSLFIVKEHAQQKEIHSAGSLAKKLCGLEPSKEVSEEIKCEYKKNVKNLQASLTSRLDKINPYNIIRFTKEKRTGDSQERYYIEPNKILIDFFKDEFFLTNQEGSK